MLWLIDFVLIGGVGGLVPVNMAAGPHHPPPPKLRPIRRKNIANDQVERRMYAHRIPIELTESRLITDRLGVGALPFHLKLAAARHVNRWPLIGSTTVSLNYLYVSGTCRLVLVRLQRQLSL